MGTVRAFIVFVGIGLLSACGMGLCIGLDGGTGCNASTLAPRLLIAGFENLSPRMNTCYPFTVTAVDEAGAQMNVSLAGSFQASSGVVIYQTLLGCQTYESSSETTSFTLSPASPVATLYLRLDVEGSLALSASVSSGVALSPALQSLASSFVAFDGSSQGVGGIVTKAVLVGNETYLVGGFQTYDDRLVANVARLDSEGRLDPSFLPTGTGLNASVEGIAVQSDGKVIVGGYFTSYNGTPQSYVARLARDGSLDTAFAQVGTGFDSSVMSVAVQSDGRVLAAGNFSNYNGTARPYVARLNSDGSLDTTFSQTGSGLNSSAIWVELQSDGKPLLGGFFSSYNGTGVDSVVRLNTSGSLDTSFSPTGSGLNSVPSRIALQSDGKLLLTGLFSSYNGTTRSGFLRLNTNGTLDTGFTQPGSGFNSTPSSVALQSDGKSFVAGGFTAYGPTTHPYLVRINTDGTLDTSFFRIPGFDSALTDVAVQTDGKVRAMGGFSSYNGTARSLSARLNPDATLDTSFEPIVTSGFNGWITSLSRTSNGKVLAAGNFSAYGGEPMPYAARLMEDGTLDSTFNQTGTGFNSNTHAIAAQNDGKVLVGGIFTSYDGTSRTRLARLHSDGSLDTSFTFPGTGLDNAVTSLFIQADSKILIGGDFTNYDGTPRARIARLNPDGSLDTGFVVGTGFDNSPHTFAQLQDGRIVISGLFTTYSGSSKPRIVRLQTDGSVDTSFAVTGTGFNTAVRPMVLLPDGKMVVGGNFTSYNGTAAQYVARLNADGSLDNSLAAQGTGLNSGVQSMALSPDGKYIVGGAFSSYNGTTRRGIARINADGSLDTSFSPSGGGMAGTVYAIAAQPDYKVLVGGTFGSVGSSTARYLARLTYIGTID